MLRQTSHGISKWTSPTPPLTPATGPGRQKTDMTQKPSVEHLTTQTLQTQVEKDRRKLSKERLKNELVSSVVFLTLGLKPCKHRYLPTHLYLLFAGVNGEQSCLKG